MARPRNPKRAETYKHEEEALLRPEVGTQAQFRKRKPPKTYRYDSSLSPALDWGAQVCPQLFSAPQLPLSQQLEAASVDSSRELEDASYFKSWLDGLTEFERTVVRWTAQPHD
jgi:hypothetical protein